MAELAVVGLVSNIISFIEFGSKLAAVTQDVRQSRHGMAVEVAELTHILSDIRSSSARVRDIQHRVHKPLCTPENNILELVSHCEQLASKIQPILDKLRKRPNASWKTYEDVRVAFRTLIERKELQELCKRLRDMDEKVRYYCARMLQSESHSVTMEQLDHIAIEQRRLQINYDHKLTDIRNDIIRLMQSSIDDAEQRTAARLTEMSKLGILKAEHTACVRQAQIIKSLYAPVLNKRWREIPNADLASNSWLFSPQFGIYLDWLKHGDGIFLITGKPGSGKSTLMKHASEHPVTIQGLEEWAALSRLCTASFYFWNLGFDLQKTQIGLLQSLLYQILRSEPTLARHLNAGRLDYETWELPYLESAFRMIADATLDTKYCFFIDGLDEYHGSEDEVVGMLAYLTQSPNIKVCASTRFRTIIQNEMKRLRHTIVISDHTRPDMANHVHKTLLKEPAFQELSSIPDNVIGCQKIVRDISEYANGVWLWVALITRNLVHAVKTGETVQTLQDITDKFPRSLEAYFKHMIDNVQPNYQAEMAKYFLVAMHQLQPLPLFAFSLLDAERMNPEYAIEARIQPVIDKHDKNMKARVRNRCGDLMEVANGPHPVFLSQPVDFMHRTVAEYLRDYHHDDLKAKLVRSDPDWKPMVSLCRFQLYLLKSLEKGDLVGPLISITDDLFYYAREIELRVKDDEISPTIAILDEVDRVNTHHASVHGLSNHWTHFPDIPMDRGVDVYFEGGSCNFLALTVQARLTKYVRAKLTQDPRQVKKRGRPLLDYALRPLRRSPVAVQRFSELDDPSVNIEMVRMLLEFDPDRRDNINETLYCLTDRSIWTSFLVSCHEAVLYSKAAPGRRAIAPSLREAWYKACEELICAGAEPRDKIMSTAPDLRIHETIRALFGARSEGLLTLMAEQPKGSRGNVLGCLIM